VSHHFRLLLIACLTLSLAPLAPSLVSGEAPGSGPDVVSTLWGMWWFQQSWTGAAWSGWSDLVNHPNGAWGTVLSPSSAILWSLFEPMLGAGRASGLVGWIQIGSLSLATAWLARVAGASWLSSGLAGVAILVGRLLFFGLGEGSVVAISALPIPLGLVGLMRLQSVDAPGGTRRWTALAVVSMGWTALENPYLAPVLPAMALLMIFMQVIRARHEDAPAKGGNEALLRLTVGLTLGVLAILLVAWMFSRSASPDYPREVAGETATLLGWDFDIVDLTHARAVPTEWFWPGEVRWTLDAEEATQARGGRYLGMSVCVLAFVGAVGSWRRTWIWSLLAVCCLALSVGSVVYGVGGLFLYLNALMSEVARPLTQPTRFLVVALIAMGVLVAFGIDWIRERYRDRFRWATIAAGSAMLLDFVLVGGGALQLPTTQIPDATCLRDLEGEGAMMIWPWDAQDGELGRSQLLQLVHERPAAHTGIASWQLHESQVTTELRNGGLNTLGSSNKRFNINHFQDRGYRYLVIDGGVLPEAQTWLEEQLDEPIRVCGPLSLYDLGTPENRPPPGDNLPAEAPQ
jgi:hypothetical protein